MHRNIRIDRIFSWVAVVMTVWLIQASVAHAESVGDAREGVQKKYIEPAKEKAAEAKQSAQNSSNAQSKAQEAAQSAKKSEEAAKEAKNSAEKLKTPSGKAETEKEGTQKVEEAQKSAQKAKEEAAKAQEEAKKAKEAEEKAKKEAEEAMKSGDSSKAIEKVEELEEARKKAKEAEEKAKKAAEEAKKAEEAAKKAEQEKADSLNPEKAKEKAKEAEEKAKKEAEEAEKAQEEARKAQEKARKDKAAAEEARKKAQEAVKKFKDRFGKKKDKIDQELDELEKQLASLVYYQVPSYRTTSVTFVVLDDKTSINEDYFGEGITYTFYAVDDTVVPAEDAATITKRPEGTQIIDVFNPGIVKTVVIGTLGKAVLGTHGGADALSAAAGEIVSSGGDIRINPDGSIKEEIITGDPIDIEKTHEYAMSINDRPVPIVAAREHALAIDGYGFAPSDVISGSGTVVVALKKPDGSRITRELPCWMARLSVAPVTRVAQPVDIHLDLEGVPGNQMVDIRFIPQPGQKIVPESISAPAGTLKGVIATVTASTAGAQQFSTVITRGILQERGYKAASGMSTEELQEAIREINLEKGARMLQSITGQKVAYPSEVDQRTFMEYQQEYQNRMMQKGVRE